MDSARFNRLINHPALLRGASMEELHSAANQFPFSPILYNLMALKTQTSNSEDNEVLLNRAAIRTPDRKGLFQLIQVGIPELEVNIIREQPDEILVPVIEPKDEQPESTSTEEIPSAQRLEPVEQTESVEAPQTDNKITSDEQVLITAETEVDSLSEKNEILEEIEETSELTFNLPGKDEALSALKSFLENKKITAEAEAEIEITAPVPDLNTQSNYPDESDEHSFTEWLNLLKSGKKEVSEKNQLNSDERIKSPAKSETTNETEIKVPENSIITSNVEIEHEIGNPKETIDKKATIRETSAEEAEKVIRQAKESLVEKNEMVTETLALIYVAQKKYEKAAGIYEQLALIYPDKKTYFAAKLESLKNK